jgi:hypothetical protein
MSSIIYIAHALILALSMLSSCYLITYQHHCLCHAFVPVYLSLVMVSGCVLLHVVSLGYRLSSHGSLLSCGGFVCVAPVDSRRIIYRLVVPVVGSSRRDRNANCNSLLRLLVVSAEWRLFPLSSSLGHGQCGLDVDVDNGAVLTRLI